jgi:hypothetical protein
MEGVWLVGEREVHKPRLPPTSVVTQGQLMSSGEVGRVDGLVGVAYSGSGSCSGRLADMVSVYGVLSCGDLVLQKYARDEN